jgi:pimeloyl-ACP methyl ester carboxylesterase
MNTNHARRALPALFALAACVVTLAAQAAPTRTLLLEDVRARFADPASRFIDVDGVSVHYRDEGTGPVLLLLHGTFGDLQDWNGWVQVLAPKFRVVRFDLPASGLTGPIASGNYSADRMLSLIDAFMDQIGIERFAIAGISYGGLLAFRYAATRTERITQLVLADSAGIEFGGRGGTGARSNRPAAAYNPLTDESVTRADVEKAMHYVVNDPARVTDALVERKLAFFNIVHRNEEAAAGSHAYERGNPQRVLAHVRAPALILWGTGNQALSTSTADAFAAALVHSPSVTVRLIQGAGHMLNIDKPEESAREVALFLGAK